MDRYKRLEQLAWPFTIVSGENKAAACVLCTDCGAIIYDQHQHDLFHMVIGELEAEAILGGEYGA
jgi:hypothetical protein